MKIFVIKASPRKNGNTSRLAEELTTAADENEHEFRTIWLPDLNIENCTGCLACQKKGGCVIRTDDIVQIEEAIQWSDVIVFACPTHWGNVSGHLLRMFERLFGFLIREQRYGFPIAQAAKGKKAIIITSCSTRWPFNFIFNQTKSVVSRIREVCRYSGIDIIKIFVCPGTFGQSDISVRYLERARKIGRRL